MDDWIKDTLKGLLLGLLACAAMQLLWGCTATKYVPVPSVSVDSVYVDRFHRDSVYLHDSVFVNRWVEGDTVFVDKVVTKYKYKDRWRYDTVAVVRADSVRVPYPIGKDLGWWQQARLKLFWPLVAVVVVLAVAVWWMIRRRRG